MHNTNILIVGQGLAGTLLSFQLRKNNIEHIVIDKPGDKVASKIAAGMFNPLVFKRLTKSWMADELLPEMYGTYNELEELLHAKFLHEIPIAKLINSDEKPWWNTRIESQNLQPYIKEFLPAKSIAGVKDEFEYTLLKQCGFVDLKKLLHHYTELLKKNKQLVHGHFNYTKLKYEHETWHYESIQAKQIVFCEGPFGSDNPYFYHIPFYLTKGDVLTAEIIGLDEDHIINKDVFVLPKGGNQFLIGSTYEHHNLTWEPNTKKSEYLLEKAQQIIKLPIKLIDHKAGIRPTTKDRRPVMGVHPKYKSMHIFNGLGTKGVMLGPYFAKLMNASLTGPKVKIPEEVNHQRFL